LTGYIINNHTFLDNPTFRGMRWHLLNSFDTIYIIDLHGNSKTKEVCPDGSPDKNVFDIQAGVSINIFVKTGKKKNGVLAKVMHSELWGSREKKYEKLLSTNLDSIAFKRVKYSKPYYFFSPKDNRGRNIYEEGFKISEFFKINSVGMATANDTLNISFSAEEHNQKIADLLNLDEREWRLKYNREKDSRDWRYLNARADVRACHGKYSFTSVTYRPFDSRYTLYTGKSRGLYSSPQVKVMKHLLRDDNLGLAFNRKVETKRNFSDVLIVPGLFSLHALSLKESNNVAPLYIYNSESDQQDIESDGDRSPNLNIEIVKKIALILGLHFTKEKTKKEDSFAPVDLLDYIYAILHSPNYRKKYRAFIIVDFPRIPFPKSPTVFWQLVKLGNDLRQIHLLKSPIVDNYITKYPNSGDNAVTRRIISKDWEITDPTSGRVWVNDTQFFENVPIIAWEMYLGGYQPAQKWLKDRFGRLLSYDDITHYQKIIVALSETNRLMKEIDKIGY